MKKKITVTLCVIFIIFNFIFSSVYTASAEGEEQSGLPETTTTTPTTTTMTREEIQKEITPTDENGNQIDASGIIGEESIKIKSNGEEIIAPSLRTTANGQSSVVTQIFIRFLTFIVEWANNIPEAVVEATDNTVKLKCFTIYSLVMGEYDFFNVNFFDRSMETESANVFDVISGNTVTEEYGWEGIADGITGDAKRLNLSGKIKEQITKRYYEIRNLSLGLSVFVLIYIGIRMAISSTASDKMKYKKMFTDWVASVFLVIFMHFIIIIFSYISGKSLQILRSVAIALGVSNIEEGILSGQLAYMGTATTGFHLMTSFITIAIFVYYQIKFLIMYVYRFCEIAILIVISPLVTITYSIDKVADNKAQAFTAWLKELSMKYAIQTIHALMYIIFIASAGVLATEVPLFAAFFILGMDKAEKIFRNVFSIKEDRFEKTKVPILDK